MGFTVISMADDWKTIYGDDVKKTGEFHWLEDLAEDITPAEEAPEDAADELIATFNQSSVLIQENPTATEFYSGK